MAIDVNSYRWIVPFMAGALLIPRPLQRILGVPVGFGLWRLMRRSREGVEANLRRVLGPGAGERRVRALAWRTFYKYGLYLLDYMSFALGSTALAREIVEAGEGAPRVARVLEEGRGAILVTPHLGNWELGGAALAIRGRPLYVLTGAYGDRALQEWRGRIRRRLGIRFLDVEAGDDAAFGAIEVARVLRAGGLVAMLADRAGRGRSVTVRFFGGPQPFPAGPAALALATGAPVIPCSIVLGRDHRYRALVDDPIEVRASSRDVRDAAIRDATQAIASAFERRIASAPDQWYNFFRFFEAGREKAAQWTTGTEDCSSGSTPGFAAAASCIPG